MMTSLIDFGLAAAAVSPLPAPTAVCDLWAVGGLVAFSFSRVGWVSGPRKNGGTWGGWQDFPRTASSQERVNCRSP